MTHIFFVRHAQPDETWEDNRTKPLTPLGLEDRKKVSALLSEYRIDAFYSSPYKRSADTIADCAQLFQMEIHTDERFRERQTGESSTDLLQRLWDDFHFCEKGGESLQSVQSRNIEALREIQHLHKDQNIVIGTHGTALSTMLHHYDPSFGCEGFRRIWFCMPYIIRLDFANETLCGSEELLRIERGY